MANEVVNVIKERLKDRWDHHRISEPMLRVYVKKGQISADDFKEITGKDY